MSLKPRAIFLLFIVILTEGYIVLSTELLAIRQTIPFVGSGTDTISIIIAAVLMPLAFGYYNGGKFKPHYQGRRFLTVRSKLLQNILVSSVFLILAISYVPLFLFFTLLIQNGIYYRLLLTGLYATIFLVTPVYLLGQTIPLVSNFFSKERLSEITGRMLFFSTIGSFLGAVLSTIILMATIGVHHTASLTFLLLAAIYLLLRKDRNLERNLPILCIAGMGLVFNSSSVMENLHIVENNQYNTIMVTEDPQTHSRTISLNNNSSSTLHADGRPHEYIHFIEKHYINPLPAEDAPKRILVIGAGGFTLGLQDTKNIYDFVDIDGSLKEVSEKYFLQKQLGPNKHFYPSPARAFLIQNKNDYDLIVLDAYFGGVNIPEHLVTQDFFKQIRETLTKGGTVVANFIVHPNFSDRFSQHIDTTFRSVFPFITRQMIEDYNGQSIHHDRQSNILYIYQDQDFATPQKVYTDNLNTIFLDKPQKR